MKHITVAIIAILFGIGSAAAQGRHDEKPHGSAKPSASATEGKYEPMAGGRHDEKPHGPRKSVQKAEGAATTEAGKTAK
jgi:hypothetical protein